MSVIRSRNERGAALIIVLLLAATLSFIVLALVTAISLSAQRTGGAALRGEILWRAVSAETIAKEAITEALNAAQSGGPALTPDHPLFSEQLFIPFTDGAGAIIFADATRCFNLNSLASGAGGQDADEVGPETELAELLKAVGLSDTEASNLANVVKDWIDADDIQSIGGAEDSFYTSLPTPYRTGGGPIASVSELRAMQGVTPELYAAVSPLVCALPTSEGSVINVNALSPDQAVLLSGLTEGRLPVRTAEDILRERPPGGWTSKEQFLALPAFQDDEIDSNALGGRIDVSPRYIEAIAGATVNEIDMNVRLLFSAASGGTDVALIRRELGTDR